MRHLGKLRKGCGLTGAGPNGPVDAPRTPGTRPLCRRRDPFSATAPQARPRPQTPRWFRAPRPGGRPCHRPLPPAAPYRVPVAGRPADRRSARAGCPATPGLVAVGPGGYQVHALHVGTAGALGLDAGHATQQHPPVRARAAAQVAQHVPARERWRPAQPSSTGHSSGAWGFPVVLGQWVILAPWAGPAPPPSHLLAHTAPPRPLAGFAARQLASALLRKASRRRASNSMRSPPQNSSPWQTNDGAPNTPSASALPTAIAKSLCAHCCR